MEKSHERANRFLEDKSSAAHELIPQLLTATVGDVVPRNDEAFPWRHVISDLVHLSVEYPPLRLLLRFPESQRRLLWPTPGGGGESGETETFWQQAVPFHQGQHSEGWEDAYSGN